MRLAGRYDGKDDTPDEDDVRPDDRPDYWTLQSFILITIQTFSYYIAKRIYYYLLW